MSDQRKSRKSIGSGLSGFVRKQRSLLLVLAAAVVFATTYILILPAMTLEQQEAAKQGGIDLPSQEQELTSDQFADASKDTGNSKADGDQEGTTAGFGVAGDSGSSEDAGAAGAAGSGSSGTVSGAGSAGSGLAFEGKGYTVSADAGAKAGLPLDVTLVANEITDEDEDYEGWRDEALKALQEADGGEQVADLKFAKFYDISLMGAEGEIEPEAPVDVTISYDKALKVSDAEHLRIVHFGVDDDGELVPEVLDAADVDATVKKGRMSETSFKAESFSVYAVVYTVDFHYEVNGETFDYSIEGGSFIALSELFEKLRVDVEVAEVEKVEFSNPELVWVGKTDEDTSIGELKEANGLDIQYSDELTEEQIAEINAQTVKAGDWALISLQPFTSEESLTVTMKNGDSFEVKVTDAQKPYKDVSTLENGTYIIYNSFDSSKRISYLKNNGSSAYFSSTEGQALNPANLSDYTWTVTKLGNGKFVIKSTNGNRYINLYGADGKYDQWSSGTYAEVSLSGSNGIVITYDNKTLKRQGSGNYIGKFYTANGSSGAGLTFFKIEENPSSSSHDTGIELTDEERAELSKWEETIEKFNTLTDYHKTAEQFDYSNRIYKIDIKADSGIMDFYKDVDLGFVLDVSNSMKFPSSLAPLKDGSDNELKVMMTATALNAARNTYSSDYNRQNCFYIISDPALTSTIYRVFKDGNQWKYQDASSNDSSKIYDINDGTIFKEPYRQAYTLYYADDKTQRIDYLNDSVAQAVATLKKIVQPTEGTDDETANVRIAYNFFAGTKTSSDGNITQYAIRGSHDFVDLRSQGSRTFEVKPKGNEADGTRQDLALYDTNNDPNKAANEFSWSTDSNDDRYVILVTDGAPNGASMSDVIAAANRLKTEDNVKIITIGLSTKDVDGGSTLLKTIADDIDGDGIKDFYEAEKASDLKHILLKILQSLMAKGLVRGTITDTIDQAFYPVDSHGNPITAGVYSSSGSKLGDNIGDYVTNAYKTIQTDDGSNTYLVRETSIADPFYTWEQIDGKWKITWYNQEIGWNDNDNTTGNPWNGTVYVKAKEDYLGGNLIGTNDSADIEPTGIKLVIDGNPEDDWRGLEGMPHIDLPVPRVNVHNLESKGNSTTWTVYKDTTVTPAEQIKALWNNIPIEEVVSATDGGNHKVTTGSSANVGTSGTGETFKLADLLTEFNCKTASGAAFNIDTLINSLGSGVGASVSSNPIIYNAYGHESGTITVTLKREVGTAALTHHNAETVGTPTEKYSLTVTYQPYPESTRTEKIVANQESGYADSTNHHNGPNGRGTEETGSITSNNNHTINVFQKGVKVTKVDKTNTEQKLEGAVFELFRADSAGTADVSSYNLPEGNYSKVGGDLTADANGVVTINPVIPDKDTAVADKILYEPNIDVGASSGKSHDTVFYLVEKTPPTVNGTTYSKMPGAIKFTMTLTEDKGSDNTATLYNWTQTATIAAAEHGNGSTTYLANDTESTTTGTNADIYAFMLKNGRPTDITLIKIDKNSQNSIGGAKFSLLRGSENVDLTDSALTITAINGGAAVTPEDYDFNGTTIKIITVPQGGIKIAGLADDTYTLQEVAAPAGYIMTDSGKTFKTENGAIKNADDSAHQNEATDIAFEVENEPGAELPNSGGPGTTWIYLIGSMLLIGCGTILIARRRTRHSLH